MFIHAAKELFGVELAHNSLEYKQLRNHDFKEISLEVEGETKLRFAMAYGFRNIQNIVQKIKKKNCHYDYVEIMACPSGCLNGGGQLRDDSTNSLSKQVLQQVESLYNSVKLQSPGHSFVKSLYESEWLASSDESRQKHLYTSYREIEKNKSGLSIKW